MIRRQKIDNRSSRQLIPLSTIVGRQVFAIVTPRTYGRRGGAHDRNTPADGGGGGGGGARNSNTPWTYDLRADL